MIDSDFGNIIPLEIDMVKTCCKTLEAKQGDINSRKFAIILTVNGTVYNIPDGTIARYAIEKPYVTAIWNNCEFISNNRIFGTLSSEAISTHGIFPMQIELWKDGAKYTSACFDLKVEKSSRIADEQVGKNEYGVLDDLIYRSDMVIQETEKVVQECIDATENITNEFEEIKNNNDSFLNDASIVLEDITNTKKQLLKDEQKRTTAENDRIRNENLRIQQSEQMQEDVDNAVIRANDAADRADSIARSFVDDSIIGSTTTWSSQKIDTLINDITARFTYVTDEDIDGIFI